MTSIVDQPPPTHRSDLIPVWDHVISDFRIRNEGYETADDGDPLRSVEHVLSDMRDRDRVGRERYGTPLTVNNGRDQLVDSYQELLDAAAYLSAAWREGTDVSNVYHRTLDSILDVRRMIDAREVPE